ncbi:MAG: PhzF family phenazine biosynthesis protein [Ghiorsea sp.]
MKLTMYQIDAFASSVFTGNPAAVFLLETWLSDQQMQSIAGENNLSETAFFVARGDDYEIRWFTPTVEVNLCGHATLAAAFVLFHELNIEEKCVNFHSKSGLLTVTLEEHGLTLNFPLQTPAPCPIPAPIQQTFGSSIETCLKAEDYIVVLKNESDVKQASPDLNLLKKLDLRGVCITAKSNKYDFVSRFFAPNYGIEEDPVTGSSFTQLTPYWAEVFGKDKLTAKQVSKRGGEVWCELLSQRVKITGKAVKYLEGFIQV